MSHHSNNSSAADGFVSSFLTPNGLSNASNPKHSSVTHRSVLDGVAGFQAKILAAQQLQSAKSLSNLTSSSSANNKNANHLDDSSTFDTSIFYSPSYVSTSNTTVGSNTQSSTQKTSSSTTNAASLMNNSNGDDVNKSSITTDSNANGSSNSTSVVSSTSSSFKSSSSSSDPAYEAWHRQYLLDQSIQQVMDQLWLTASSEESKARLKFLKTFPKLLANNQTQKNCTIQTFFIQIRQFLDSFRMYIEKKRMKQLQGLLVPKYLTLQQFEDSILARIERTTEVAILVPLFKPLATLLNPNSHSTSSSFARVLFELTNADAAIAVTMNRMKDQPQEAFGVDPSHVSMSQWNHAQKELLNLHQFELPADKIQVLLGTAKAIYQTFQYEQKLQAIQRATEQAELKGISDPTPLVEDAVKTASKIMLSGDAFMPIFTYVVSQSLLKSPSKLAFFMWQLCDPKQLTGEAGYYLTVFDAALQYLKNGAPEPTHSKKK